MIFLSAVPDNPYFIWQIEVQLYNFHQFRINYTDIHILVGFNPAVGVDYQFMEFIEAAKGKAKFFLYPDTRTRKR